MLTPLTQIDIDNLVTKNKKKVTLVLLGTALLSSIAFLYSLYIVNNNLTQSFVLTLLFILFTTIPFIYEYHALKVVESWYTKVINLEQIKQINELAETYPLIQTFINAIINQNREISVKEYFMCLKYKNELTEEEKIAHENELKNNFYNPNKVINPIKINLVIEPPIKNNILNKELQT